MNLTPKQRATRRYFFRSLVAEHGASMRKSGKSPMILTWREARLMWKGATAAVIYCRQFA